MNKDVLDNTLLPSVVKEASFDALGMGKLAFPATCMTIDVTRTAILQDFLWWSKDFKCASRFSWVTGPIGVGKTSVLRDVAFKAYHENRLAGDFFFRRWLPDGIGQTLNGFTATIAYCMAVQFAEVGRTIAKTLEEEPNILQASQDKQWDNLIIKPLRSITTHPTFRPVFVIDGLDTCRSRSEQTWVLQKLVQLCERFPVVAIVSSRPEEHIYEEISRLQQQNPSLFRANIELGDTEDAREDMRRLLGHAELEREELRPPYLKTRDEVTSRILADAAGQFFYLAIVSRYEIRRIGGLATLYDVLCANLEYQAETFVPLDDIYDDFMHGTLSQLTDNQIPVLKIIFYHLLHVQHPDSINGIAKFWGKSITELRSVLRYLPSVLQIPLPDSIPMSFHHPSFALFLSSPFRGGNDHLHHIPKDFLLVEAFERNLYLTTHSGYNKDSPLGISSLWMSLALEIHVLELNQSDRDRIIHFLNDVDFWSWMTTYGVPEYLSGKEPPLRETFYGWLQDLHEGSLVLKFPSYDPHEVHGNIRCGTVISLVVVCLSTSSWATSMSIVEISILLSLVIFRLILRSIPILIEFFNIMLPICYRAFLTLH